MVVVGLVRNKSHEHIASETFIKDLERAFIKSGMVRVVQAGKEREEIHNERADQQEFASPKTMKKWGREIGADFMMQGTFNSIVDSYRDEKVVFYQINLELTNLETNEIVWIGDKPKKEKNALKDLEVIRIALPKYLERKPYYNRGHLIMGDSTYILQLAEDINAIAFKTLQDRMLRELAHSLLRLASKKALEQLAEEHDEGLGAAMSLVNAISEQADTRNWQTLPYSIYYRRIPVKKTDSTLLLITKGKHTIKQHRFNLDLREGQTRFISFHSLGSYMPQE